MSENQEELMGQDDIEEVIELDDNAAQETGQSSAPQEIDQDDDFNDVEDMEEVVDESLGQFTEHNEAVLCCDVSKDDQLVVTGGQDDKAVVWESGTQKVKFEIGGHKDSVIAVKFNANSTMVATGDMSGFIQVFDMTGQRCYDFEVDDLNWMLWHPVAENVLFAGTKTDAWMWKLSQTNPQCKTFQSFGSENMCAKIFNDGKRIVMGYEDGSIRIWNLKDTRVIHSITGNQAHKGSVICLDLNSDNTLIASGSTDSTVKIINAINFKVLMTISIGSAPTSDAEEMEGDSIESVAFSGKNLLALGSVNGVLEIWDVSSQTRRSELKLGSQGVSKIATDKANPSILYCGCLDAQFRVIDLRSCDVIATRTGHTDQILDFVVSADSKYVLTCSEDATCKIFALSQ